MILKKPYAILIKYFKLIHVFLTIFIVYTIYKVNLLLKFFNNYISNQTSVVGQNLKDNLYTNLMFVIPIIILLISIALLWLMIKKKKPYRFYLVNTFIYIIVFIVIVYTSIFLGNMEKSLVDVVNVRVVRDLLTITILLQSVSLIVSFIRAIGFDIKSFEFLSDLQQLQLDEEDKEEYEIDFSIDSNERRRKRKRKLRYLKYTYRENKIFINIFLLLIIGILCFVIYKNIGIYTKLNKEGSVLSTNYYNFGVEESYLINTSYKGNTITDNYLVVLKLKIRINSNKNRLITGNFKLQVGDNSYITTNKYDKYLIDLGTVYNNDALTSEYSSYLLVYEIPKEDINESIKLIYLEEGKNVKVKLNPIKYDDTCNNEYQLGENIKLKDQDVININSYELQEIFTVGYDYCIKDKCYNSIQYLVPTLDTNYDKVILKLIGTANVKEDSLYSNFNQLMANLVTIEYKIGDQTKTTSITRITNLKKTQLNTYYYEVNKELMLADSIKLVFNTRKCKYSYVLK